MIPSVRRFVPFFTVLPLVAGLVLGATPNQAHAQFGGLLKKAAEKAVDKASGAEDKVAPNVSGAELTDDAITRLVTGLGVTLDKLTQRDALQEQLQAKDKELSDLREANGAAIRSWENAKSTWQSCMSNQFNKFQEARKGQEKALQMKFMSDPAKMRDYSMMTQKYATESQAAMAAGDTLKVAALQAKYTVDVSLLMGIDIKADSAKAFGVCGTEPKPLAVMARIQTLETQRETLQAGVRDLETTAQIDGAKAAAMPLPEFALQKEKVQVFLGSDNGGRMLTRIELDRVRARRAELQKVRKALN